ncbi:hypothetical protein F441_01844 [Phytophthora nicotianae CJ01A1]|uniref:AGC-kinase C-terminal domain-containing protein n=2 Tax=Phytophthora nicotianae TaxID=4792 RepID=W2XS93_PHYNI|nr:hypothetical protein L915_01807 [Phytophthora nicotianae]ETP25263.1 hypothetical protein F441_01844 [Phytophthora nicotianae CJ01A1]
MLALIYCGLCVELIVVKWCIVHQMIGLDEIKMSNWDWWKIIVRPPTHFRGCRTAGQLGTASTMSGKEAWKPFVKFEYQNLLPAELRNKLRKMLVFTEATGTKQVNQSPAVSQGYRYPSPDKQAEGVSVPSSDSKESIYNIQYYTRDIRRFPFPTEVGMHPSIPVEKRAEIPADAKRGSPGNKNPAVLRYDPTGTRSAMSTTHEARDKLILQHASTHNVRFEWEGDAEKDILEDLEAKNLPPTPGRPFVWDFPSQSRVMRW